MAGFFVLPHRFTGTTPTKAFGRRWAAAFLHPPRAGFIARGEHLMSEQEEAMTVHGGISSKGILSIRVVVETVAVAAILWLANSVNQGNLAIARMQVQLTQVQSTLADVPGLTREIAQMQTSQAEHDRRITALETDHVSRR